MLNFVAIRRGISTTQGTSDFRTVDEDWLALALSTNTGLPVIIVTELKLIFEVFQKWRENPFLATSNNFGALQVLNKLVDWKKCWMDKFGKVLIITRCFPHY